MTVKLFQYKTLHIFLSIFSHIDCYTPQDFMKNIIKK